MDGRITTDLPLYKDSLIHQSIAKSKFIMKNSRMLVMFSPNFFDRYKNNWRLQFRSSFNDYETRSKMGYGVCGILLNSAVQRTPNLEKIKHDFAICLFDISVGNLLKGLLAQVSCEYHNQFWSNSKFSLQGSQRRIQGPVKHLRWGFLKNNYRLLP